MKRTIMMTGAAILAATVIFQIAIPASASTIEPGDSVASESPAPDSPTADSPTDSDVGTTAGVVGRMTASIDPRRLTLSEGRESGERKGNVTLINASPSSPSDAWRIDGTYNVNGGNTATGLNGTVDYRISILGQPTDYWVRTSMYEWFGYQEAQCAIYEGDPNDGGTRPQHTPYLCDPTYPEPLPDGHVTFTVTLNRVAEESGIVKAGPDVHLEDGSFETDNQIHFVVPGATSVAANTSTAFNAVLLEGESPADTNQVRTTFHYRIYSGGIATRFWVGGYVDNFSGTNAYSPDAQCHIYMEDPTDKALSTLKPQDVTPFACDITTQQIDAPHKSHVEATFSISKRALRVENSPQAQQSLISRLCGAGSNNCGLSLANVTEYTGPEVSLSDTRGNGGDTNLIFDVQTSVKQGITNTVGVKVSQGFEESGLWGTYKATIELSWGISISHEITHTATDHALVKPGRKGHLAGAPTMITAAGSVIVRDGDTYWELPGVSMDIPKENGWLIYTTDDGPFTPPLTGPETPGGGLAGLDPALAGVDPASAAAAQAAAAKAAADAKAPRGALASTGGVMDGTAFVFAAAGVMLGAGWLMVSRRRRRAAR